MGKDCNHETCDLIVVNLSAFHDGELDEDTQRLMEQHLSTCLDCARILKAMQETDAVIQREWRETAALPSSFAVDAIMNALPAQPSPPMVLEPNRVHARTRWIRFATNVCCTFLLLALLISSYALGFLNGRDSRGLHPAFDPVSAVDPPRTLTHVRFAGILYSFTLG